jgi:hypothetical protein
MVDFRRHRPCLVHQVLSDLIELRIGDTKSRVRDQQQERRNDRGCEHDQQLPQGSRLLERRHRSDPQDDAGGDAETANEGRQRWCLDRPEEHRDAGYVDEQTESRHGAT